MTIVDAATNDRRTREEQNLLARDVDVRAFILDLVGPRLPSIDVSESLISGEVLLDMTGASQVTVTIHDQAREILRSGALYDKEGHLRAADVKIDGLWFRLTAIRKTGPDLELTLELRDIAWIRAKRGPRKLGSRAKVTRAMAVLALVRSIKKRKIPVHIPRLHEKQPVESERASQTESERKSDRKRKGGFDAGTHIEGVTKMQLKNITVFMQQADADSAPDRAIMAGLVAGFGESQWSKISVEQIYGTHKGVFQSDQIPPNDLVAQSHHFLVGGRSFRAGGAIQAVKDHPNWSLGQIAQYVEISDGAPALYDQYRSKARAVFDAWSGTGGGSDGGSYYKQYAFRVEKHEDYWTAIQRMAGEVNWRAFFSGNVFYYISEEQLFKSRARYRCSERTDGIVNIDFDENYRKRILTATITARIDRWACPPGTVIILDGLNPTGSKRWLVQSIRRNLFSPEAEITCKRPIGERKEPRSDKAQRSTSDSAAGTGKRGRVTGDLDGLHDDLMVFLQEIAGETDEKIFISAGMHNHDANTVAGNRSNHADGWAADIGCNGDARSSEAARRMGDNIATAVLVVCGEDRKDARRMLGGPRTSFAANSQWNGYSVEIGWRTLVGGNHYTHVHVGFDIVGPGGSRRKGAPQQNRQDL